MKNLSQLEREYFVKKVGAALPTESLNSIKRRYFVSFLTGDFPVDPDTSIIELESNWLTKVVTTGGATITDDEDYAALWKIAVAQLEITPSNYLNQNKRLFFASAPE